MVDCFQCINFRLLAMFDHIYLFHMLDLVENYLKNFGYNFIHFKFFFFQISFFYLISYFYLNLN